MNMRTSWRAFCTAVIIVLPTSVFCSFNADVRRAQHARQPQHTSFFCPNAARLRTSLRATAESSAKDTAVVERLYEKLNLLDARGTAACFTENVVYEDLMFGDSSIVASREEFEELIGSQPVFVCAAICKALDLSPWKVVVDSISEDPLRHTVAVSWHVEAGGQALVLGKGLSFFRICPETGLIQKATDISEAPWRALGWLLAPIARSLRDFNFLNLLADLALISVVTIVFTSTVYLDKESLNGIRNGLDAVDDFRGKLDDSSLNIKDLYANIRGLGM